jgi:aryl-phospho-beta-D-glucosidase BglC (GH1 family)
MRPSLNSPLAFNSRHSWRPGFAALVVLLSFGCARGTGSREGQVEPPTVVAARPWTAPQSAPPGTPVAEYGQLEVLGTRLSNQAGDAVQLKGVSSMWLNYESKGYAADKNGLAWMRDNWKLKVFRAAMGIEPAGGYLSSPISSEAKVRVIVRNAIDLGVYVIIDWHDHHAHVNVEEAVAFFSKMAEEFGDFPNVIYEPFNEPQCIEVTDRCGADGRIEWPQLKEYHERVVAAIREKDPDNIIILGTPTWSQDVHKAAEDPLVGDNLMYTLHFYSCTHTDWLIQRAKNALKDGLPLFVTEWGATPADGGLDGTVCLPEGEAWHQFMDEEYISWAAWKYDACSDSSCFFKSAAAPTSGGWSDDILGGHTPFVRDRMLINAPPRKASYWSDSGVAPISPDSGPASISDAASTDAASSDAASTDADAVRPREAGLSADSATSDAADVGL